MRAGRAVVLLVAFALIGALLYGWYMIFGDRSHPQAQVSVVVPRGATFRDVAQELANAGVIGNPAAFRAYAKFKHADTDAHAGEYRFAPHQTPSEILQQLQNGGAQIAKWLTIPEGYTAAQIASELQQDALGSAEEYKRAFLHDAIVVDGTRTRNLEGFLFPSTYLLPLDSNPQIVERTLTGQFLKELPADAAQKAHGLGLTVPQVVTVASLIEREGKADDERPLIASVIYNRLRLRMPLEVDATIEYALPTHHTVITYSDLRINSPYNSYSHTGLPPTPIANPGLPSLLAAFNPRRSDYLYYVYKGNGHHVFAKTLEEQNANVAKYLK